MADVVTVYFLGFFAVGLIAGGVWREEDTNIQQLRVIACVMLWPVTLLGAMALSVIRLGHWCGASRLSRG